jgi:hypothetical protein
MNSAWFLVAILCMASSVSHTPVISAKMRSIDTAQCRQGESVRYDVHVGGTVEVTNTSDRTILMPKKINIVRTVLAASSMEEAAREKYVFVMNQEFGGSESASVHLEDFVVLKSRANGRAQIEPTVIPVTADSNNNPSQQLGPGTYWVRLEFATIPASLFLHAKELAIARKKWRASGSLVNSYVVTQPFRLDVVPDRKAPKCDR